MHEVLECLGSAALSPQSGVILSKRAIASLNLGPEGSHGLDSGIKPGLNIGRDAGRPPGRAETCDSDGHSEVTNLVPHLALVDFVFVVLFLRSALQDRAVLTHLVGNLHVLRLRGRMVSLLRQELRLSKGHGFSMANLGGSLKVLERTGQVSLGLGAKERSLGPELIELTLMQLCSVGLAGLGLPSELRELATQDLNSALRIRDGRLGGQLGCKDLGVESDALCLQCSDFVSQSR